MHSRLLLLAASAVGALADWNGNMNFESPSLRHRSLGIDLNKVRGRMIEKRDNQNWTASSLNFTHGVASGDPYSDSVILWTRIAPSLQNDRSNITVEGFAPLYNHETAMYVQASTRPICVQWKVTQSKNLTGRIVSSGRAYTTSDIDYTVKVEATNLNPFTTYYYQFTVCGTNKTSPIGRTKTSPCEDDNAAQINLAVYSCSNYPNGYFNSYGNPARKDSVDYVLHLGDYIYESSVGKLGTDPRASNPAKTLFSLYDYRTRIGQYRTDLDLLLSHQQFPWISVWDDHEVADNTYRDGESRLNNTEASFLSDGGVSVDQRKMNAVRAYFEWMPIRQVELDDNLRIWRNFKMGKLLDLIMLDTRQYDRSITDLYWNTHYTTEIKNDAGRTMMGSHQENWFYRTLSESKTRGAAWRIIGNQVVFSRINVTSWFGTFENPYNTDQWDGYMANRNRTLHHMYSNGIGNNIMLAGDSHANWVSDLVWYNGTGDYNPATGAGSIGVEFAGTAVSSSGYGTNINQSISQARTLVRDNPELMWTEGYYRGYYELCITPQRVDARYYGMPTVSTRNPYEIPIANFSVLSNANKLLRPVGNGVVENGVLANGVTRLTNITYDTSSKSWTKTNYSSMYIKYSS